MTSHPFVSNAVREMLRGGQTAAQPMMPMPEPTPPDLSGDRGDDDNCTSSEEPESQKPAPMYKRKFMEKVRAAKRFEKKQKDNRKPPASSKAKAKAKAKTKAKAKKSSPDDSGDASAGHGKQHGDTRAPGQD